MIDSERAVIVHHQTPEVSSQPMVRSTSSGADTRMVDEGQEFRLLLRGPVHSWRVTQPLRSNDRRSDMR